MLSLYKYFSYILIPIILINLYLRLINNKEDKKRYKERFGITDYNIKFSKKVVWIHAASIGEFKSSHLLIEKYYNDFQILVTTTTKTSAEYIKKYYFNKVVHQYIPYDVPLWCLRFMHYWKPSLVLWIESDIWPNMLKIIREKKIKSFYINARISPRSFKKWKSLKDLYSVSLSTFDKIYAQSPNDLKRIKILSNENTGYIRFIGNLKLSDYHKSEIHHDKKKKFSIMLASTHNSEEEIIIKNLKQIVNRNRLKICIAPRHPERIKHISKLLIRNNFSYSLDSEKKDFKHDILLIDSFGKLDSYFSISDIVILGGSFISKGGHNPIEAAKHGCAIISGIHIYNWENIYEDMLKNEACKILDNINNLGDIIAELLSNKDLLENYKKRALDFSNKKFFDNETLFEEINLVLN